MAVYQVITVPDQGLREKAQPVRSINDGVLRVVDNMIDTMHACDGLGLAAPQIGINKRIIVLEAEEKNTIALINPELIRQEGVVSANEGCLSIPDLDGVVERAERVSVTGLNLNGEEVHYEADGILARAFQHEIDHLDGILFTDKAKNIRKKQ